MDFQERLKKGKEFENEVFKVFYPYNEIKHSSDLVIWKDNSPIFIEVKSSQAIEWQSWLDQIKIANNGYKVIIVAKDNEIIMADWIENISIQPKRKGIKGSFNDWTILIIRKKLEDLLKEL